MKNVHLKLQQPFDISAGAVTKLILREPTGRELLQIGEPMVTTRSADGGVILVENTAAIEQYLNQIVTEPANINVLDRVGLADAMALKDALFDFFASARAAGVNGAPSSSSPNSDGSTPADSATLG